MSTSTTAPAPAGPSIRRSSSGYLLVLPNDARTESPVRDGRRGSVGSLKRLRKQDVIRLPRPKFYFLLIVSAALDFATQLGFLIYFAINGVPGKREEVGWGLVGWGIIRSVVVMSVGASRRIRERGWLLAGCGLVTIFLALNFFNVLFQTHPSHRQILLVLLLVSIILSALHYLTFAVFVGISRERNPFAGPTLGLDSNNWKRGTWREEDVQGGWQERNVRLVNETVLEEDEGDFVEQTATIGITENSPLLESGPSQTISDSDDSESEDDPDELIDIPEPDPIVIKTVNNGTGSTSVVGSVIPQSLRSKRSRMSLITRGGVEEGRTSPSLFSSSPKRERGYGSFMGI